VKLMTEARIEDPDGFYEELVGSQRELDDEAAERMNARLILLLANHVGDREVLSEAIRLARAAAH
jgi:hypothetical protein